ncbi:MAG: GHKL domain-containing protein [Clostridia bacterium]|nr:GHKL domain-containing protein [Clostridia bacterium]
MTAEGLHFLYAFASLLVICALTTLTCCLVSGEPIRLKTFMKVFGILWLVLIINIFTLDMDSPLKMIFAVLGILASYLLIYRFRGRKLILRTFTAMAIEFGGDMFTGFAFLNLFDSQTVAAMRYMTEPSTILLQAVCGGSMVCFAMLYRMILAFFQHRRINLHLGYLLRPAFLMGIVCMVYVNAFRHATQTDQVLRFQQMLPDFIIAFLLLVIGVTYVLQDIRAYKQAEENKSLQHQQELQNIILQDTRVFRHNISNLLYGFQGTLLSGDLDAIKAYYENMTTTCQMINNENVSALQRVPSAAVSTLLLHKVHAASEEKLPMFITVDEDTRWFGFRDEEMVQVLGILLDNAMEAARESAAPFVSFEARNVEDALSITIRNTCGGEEMPVFTSEMASSKEGHEGLGLKSLRKIIKKHNHILFNLYTRGRYVEASLMIYKG